MSRLCDTNPDLLESTCVRFNIQAKVFVVCAANIRLQSSRFAIYTAASKKVPIWPVSLALLMDLHNEKFFGLLKCDQRSIFCETVRSYKKAMGSEVRKNAKHLKKRQKKYYEEYMIK